MRYGSVCKPRCAEVGVLAFDDQMRMVQPTGRLDEVCIVSSFSLSLSLSLSVSFVSS